MNNEPENPPVGFGLCAALLRTNKQIYEEASAFLYGNNQFQLGRLWWGQRGVLVHTAEEYLQRFSFSGRAHLIRSVSMKMPLLSYDWDHLDLVQKAFPNLATLNFARVRHSDDDWGSEYALYNVKWYAPGIAMRLKSTPALRVTVNLWEGVADQLPAQIGWTAIPVAQGTKIWEWGWRDTRELRE